MIQRLVADACCLMAATAIVFYGVAIYAAWRWLRTREPAEARSDGLPPVSILKPLCGVDGDLYENLASACRQAYPRFEMLCGVQDPADPCVPVVQRVAQEFPTVAVRLVVSSPPASGNPKISNLIALERQAQHPLLVIADSDIRVGPDYLRRLVRPFRDPAVGAVTCLCRARGRGVAGVIEALRLAAFSAGVLVARVLEGMSFALGSTIVVRRTALDAIGGFRAIAGYLADDYMLGHQVARAGFTVLLSTYVVDHRVGTSHLGEVLARQLRWNRGVRVSRPWGYLGLFWTYGVPASLALVLATRGSSFGWRVLGLTWGMRWVMAAVVAAARQDRIALRWLWATPLTDLLDAVMWGWGLWGSTVIWRGQRFQVTREGKLVPSAMKVPADSLRIVAGTMGVR